MWPDVGYNFAGVVSERQPWTNPKKYRLGTRSLALQYWLVFGQLPWNDFDETVSGGDTNRGNQSLTISIRQTTFFLLPPGKSV